MNLGYWKAVPEKKDSTPTATATASKPPEPTPTGIEPEDIIPKVKLVIETFSHVIKGTPTQTNTPTNTETETPTHTETETNTPTHTETETPTHTCSTQ